MGEGSGASWDFKDKVSSEVLVGSQCPVPRATLGLHMLHSRAVLLDFLSHGSDGPWYGFCCSSREHKQQAWVVLSLY